MLGKRQEIRSSAENRYSSVTIGIMLAGVNQPLRKEAPKDV
jgi:hypothetical protein